MEENRDTSVDAVNQYFKHMSSISKDIDRKEMDKLWHRIRRGDKAAKQKMMELNLRLVVPAAKRFMRKDIELLDLIEEGNLGLMQAIEKFRPSKGFRFSTYAIYWIEQAIRKYIDEQGGTIKIPSHAWGDIKKWTRVWNALKENLGREPALTEMAHELDWSARKVKSILETINAAKGVDSLAAQIGDEDEITLEETLADDGKGNPDDMFSRSSSNTDLLAALQEMDARDREVLMMRHGLQNNEPMTLSEVADKLNLSRERVRQIEERAINHIRKKAQKLGILEVNGAADRRPLNIHTGMETKARRNVLGEITGSSDLEKLFKQKMLAARAASGIRQSKKLLPAAKPSKNKPAKKAAKKVSKKRK